MTTWKYIKGSEKDFKGAPEWATHRMFNYQGAGTANKDNQAFTNGAKEGSKWVCTIDKTLTNEIKKPDEWHLIAQRERVTSINDDRLARDVNALITERGNRYGKFKDGAEIMRDLKHVMQHTDGWSRCTPSQKEALDMIQHKIGRILNGDPTYDDNWKDIAGYATLIVEELNGVSK